MKILAVVITYRPDVDLLKRDISSFSDHVDGILIWDNTGDNSLSGLGLFDGLNVKIVSGQVNSISKGLNYAWRYAKENGYDCLLTMDQDSVFRDFASYKDFALSMIGESPCIVAPWPKDEEEQDMVLPDVIVRETVITSGMVVPMSIIDTVDGWCEDFTVDGIDIDFCKKARLAGYKVYQYMRAEMDQCFGVPYRRKLFKKEYVGNDRSPFRLYGIFRNHIIIYRRYNHPEDVRLMLRRYYRHYIPRIILWEKSKFSKLHAILKGTVAGVIYKIQ